MGMCLIWVAIPISPLSRWLEQLERWVSHLIAGLEGGYVSEQLAPRANAKVHKVELLQLADEKYPIRAERLEDVLEQSAGKKVRRIGLLTPRQVIPCGIVDYLEQIVGSENVVDAQELYQRIRYEKSDIEMALIRDAAVIGDAMMRCMLAVLRPGLLETQVAAWAYWVGQGTWIGRKRLGCNGHLR